jgi:hypothetical protein
VTTIAPSLRWLTTIELAGLEGAVSALRPHAASANTETTQSHALVFFSPPLPGLRFLAANILTPVPLLQPGKFMWSEPSPNENRYRGMTKSVSGL